MGYLSAQHGGGQYPYGLRKAAYAHPQGQGVRPRRFHHTDLSKAGVHHRRIETGIPRLRHDQSRQLREPALLLRHAFHRWSVQGKDQTYHPQPGCARTALYLSVEYV